MIEPELWGKNSDLTILSNIDSLDKFKHLIKWKRNESILEFGMADGENTKQSLLPRLPNDFKEYIGTDVSQPMIDYAKKNILSPKCSFMVLDIGAEKIPEMFENRFDHIFGFFVMHWVQNTKQAFENMYKMLKPDGQLFLTFADEVSFDDIFSEFEQHPKWSKYNHKQIITPYFNHPNPQGEYQKWLVKAGFKEFEYKRERKIYTFPDKKSFTGFCLSVNPILKKIPIEEYNEYEEEYLRKMSNNKLNFTTKCPNIGDIVHHSSLELNVVLTQKKLY